MQSASYQTGTITATTDPFFWGGGQTSFNVSGTIAALSELNLQVLGPDNTTWLEIASKTAPGHSSAQLGPGQYRFEIVGTVSAVAELARVPV